MDSGLIFVAAIAIPISAEVTQNNAVSQFKCHILSSVYPPRTLIATKVINITAARQLYTIKTSGLISVQIINFAASMV